MKIAIHHSRISFSKRWIQYCKDNSIQYKIVSCYQNDIIQQIGDCDILMWHFHHANAKDVLFAKQLLYAVQAAGKKIFPDFNTSWHFDDKAAQKYLLEAMDLPLVPSYVFYDKTAALVWAGQSTYPKVFKLRRGAGSINVQLVKSISDAVSLINRAFGKGFKYTGLVPLSDIYYKVQKGIMPFSSFLKGLVRTVFPGEFAKSNDNEKGYIYFQDFIPDNTFDIRVVVVGKKAFAIKRLVRENDFRASGSGNILYDKALFDEQTILLSFNVNEKLKAQCLALDYIYQNGKAMIVEISFGFFAEGYDDCPGYWDSALQWHEGKFNPYGWMVDNIIEATQ